MVLEAKKIENTAECIVAKQVFDINRLIRFVLGPDDEIIPDLKGQLPGKSVWILSRIDKVELAVKERLFEEVFGNTTCVKGELHEQVRQLLYESAIKRLSLANKCGSVISGFSKIHAALGNKEIIALLHAKSASINSCKKLDKKFFNISNAIGCEAKVFNVFDEKDMSKALGLPNAVHLAMKKSGATASFLGAIADYEQYIDTREVM